MSEKDQAASYLNERRFYTCANPRLIKFRTTWRVRNCSMLCGIDYAA